MRKGVLMLMEAEEDELDASDGDNHGAAFRDARPSCIFVLRGLLCGALMLGHRGRLLARPARREEAQVHSSHHPSGRQRFLRER